MRAEPLTPKSPRGRTGRSSRHHPVPRDQRNAADGTFGTKRSWVRIPPPRQTEGPQIRARVGLWPFLFPGGGLTQETSARRESGGAGH
jgi:hypothetical protein